ncbi:MAG: YpsA SLOG family protein [Balneolaceae bacterium]
MTIQKIISGGQTGVDQAALQAAIDTGIEHGGWCPPGRVCENGEIPNRFILKETPLERDPSAPSIPRSQRTIWNIRDSEGALIFSTGNNLEKDKGTQLAVDTAVNLGKPIQLIDINKMPDYHIILEWIIKNKIRELSVGGPSEKSSPGIFNYRKKKLSGSKRAFLYLWKDILSMFKYQLTKLIKKHLLLL